MKRTYFCKNFCHDRSNSVILAIEIQPIVGACKTNVICRKAETPELFASSCTGRGQNCHSFRQRKIIVQRLAHPRRRQSMARFVKGDIVVIPFPFSDLSSSKKRPAFLFTPTFQQPFAASVALLHRHSFFSHARMASEWYSISNPCSASFLPAARIHWYR